MLMKMRSQMQRTNNQKGFTLVELMVVVVIIGILVAIAVPIYNNVSEKAKQNTHDANVRILTGAGTSYYAGLNGALTATETWNASTNSTHWQIYLNEWPADPFARAGGYSVTINTNGTVTVSPAAKTYPTT